MLRSSTVALAAALVALTAGAGGAEARSVPQGFFGANWDGEVAVSAPRSVQDPEWARMATTGSESARTAFNWASAQPKKKSRFSFARTDHLVQLAAEHGIELLPYVFHAPAWAARYPATYSPPARASDYTKYLVALVRRYGPAGTFWTAHPEIPKRPIRYWQIWNEPSKRYQWTIPKKQDYAPGYGALLRASYKSIKHADPGAKVVLAGLADYSYLDLRHLYEKGRIRGFFDVAAIHPYTTKQHGVLTLVAHFKHVLKEKKDPKKPVWVTEVGLPASKGRTLNSSPLQTTDAGMAAFLKESYTDLIKKRRTTKYGVERAYWYTWASTYDRGNEEIFNFSGLVHYDKYRGTSTTVPAYDEYLKLARQAEGCVKDVRGACAARSR
jgi:hypothetical protein